MLSWPPATPERVWFLVRLQNNCELERTDEGSGISLTNFAISIRVLLALL